MSIDKRAAELLGAPWLPGGRGHGSQAGIDCLGLAMQILDDPPPDVRNADFEQGELAGKYEPVDGELVPGDLLLSHSIREGKRIAHLSIVSDVPGFAWTTTQGTGVVKMRISSLPKAKPYRRK